VSVVEWLKGSEVGVRRGDSQIDRKLLDSLYANNALDFLVSLDSFLEA